MKYLGYFLFTMLVFLSAQTAQAQGTERRTPLMIVEPIDTVPVGTRVTVSLVMQNEEGRLLPNLPIILTLDGERIRRARTDDLGRADMRISEDLPVGTYNITVEFIGTRAYFPVIQEITLTVRPIDLTIQTVPPLPNVQFLLNGATLSTDENGIALTHLERTGTYALKAIPLPGDRVNDKTRASFRRWGDSIFEASRTVEVLADTYIEAGYIVSHRVGQKFFGLDGKPIDDSRIDTITLKSSAGDRYIFEDGQLRWLDATRINRSREHIEATPILYSVETVVIDGSNTVNRYQQRFYVEPEAIWDIQLLLYYARIRVFDALFGFPVGNGIALEYPNGEIEHIPYGPGNEASIGPMARGTYRVKPLGVQGMIPFTPVALSRDQDVELKALTVFDMALSGALGIALAVGLLLYGRPQLIRQPFVLLSTILKPRATHAEAAPVYAVEASTALAEIMQPVRSKSQRVRVRTLSTKENRELQQVRERIAQNVVSIRCDMILLSDEGLSAPIIGRQVQFSAQTVRRYIKRYNTEGIHGLFNRPKRSRQPGAMPTYLSQLEQGVERELGEPMAENPAAYLANQTSNGNGRHKAHNGAPVKRETDVSQESSYAGEDSEFNGLPNMEAVGVGQTTSDAPEER